MATYTEISPNEPDVLPDYVDGKTPPSATAVHEAPPRTRTELQPPEYVDTQSEPARMVEPIAEPPSASSAHRDGECVPNVPDVPPDTVSEAEAAAVAGTATVSETVPDFEAPPSRWMRWSLAGTVLVVAAFGVLVFSQAISALALAATLPVWAQYALLIPLGFCCLAVIGVCLALVRSWLRLRALRQVDLGALEELRSRAQTRQDGVEHFQEARGRLEDYLGRYPLDVDGRIRLAAAGVQPHEIETLAAGREHLAGRATDSRSWLVDFREHFQNGLDAAANRRVNAWAVKAAGCVIASPLPLLDAALILGISFKMLKDLSSMYNVRTGRAGSLVLLNRAVAAAFLAGVAEDATEIAGGLASEELAGMVGEGTLTSAGAKVAGVVAPKLGEGALNALFVRRLGKAAIRLLQPLRPQK